MGLRSQIKLAVRKILARYRLDIIPANYVYDWQRGEGSFSRGEVFLPPGAREELRMDNPVLLDLQERYRQYADYPSDQVLLWTPDLISSEDLLYFRGHNAYVFQEGRFNRNLIGYMLTYYYIKAMDQYGLLDKAIEDSAFGAISYPIDNRYVSRDLLDSLLEIYFLDDHLGIMSKKGLKVLDIGAGYGRLAHRMVEALPNLESYLCTDAVAISTFLADYYLDYRGISDKARSVPLDQIYDSLTPGSIDLAVSIHSFSECALPAIQWWMELLAAAEVPSLLIVPNSKHGLLTNEGQDFRPLVEENGYQFVATQPKYKDPALQKYALNPDYFHLYKRR